ncbi:hypothetical protein RB599_010261 [Gaeumannomyces hyphopodioides]
MFPIILFLAVTQSASAHFRMPTPAWRDDSLAPGTTYSQYIWPCELYLALGCPVLSVAFSGDNARLTQSRGAGVPYNESTLRTEWPLTGGSVSVNSSHTWDYLWVNLGLGNNVTNYNISLTPQLLNKTGKGVICLPSLPVPAGAVTDGQNASVQVVMTGVSGNVFYNCAEIKFRAAAQLAPATQCRNDTGNSVSVVGAAPAPFSNDTCTSRNAAPSITVNTVALAGVVGLMATIILAMLV